MKMMRKPIRRQMMITTALIVLLALVTAAGAALFVISKIQEDSENQLFLLIATSRSQRKP